MPHQRSKDVVCFFCQNIFYSWPVIVFICKCLYVSCLFLLKLYSVFMHVILLAVRCRWIMHILLLLIGYFDPYWYYYVQTGIYQHVILNSILFYVVLFVVVLFKPFVPTVRWLVVCFVFVGEDADEIQLADSILAAQTAEREGGFGEYNASNEDEVIFGEYNWPPFIFQKFCVYERFSI